LEASVTEVRGGPATVAAACSCGRGCYRLEASVTEVRGGPADVAAACSCGRGCYRLEARDTVAGRPSRRSRSLQLRQRDGTGC
ncbi:MAG: hypothetical protein AAFP92_31495, partial [Bacteroidota bacterium]